LSEANILDLEFGIWNLEFGIWNLEFGIWNLEFGIWNLEFGIWNLEFELRIIRSYSRYPFQSFVYPEASGHTKGFPLLSGLGQRVPK
jgi:hypothetical protein